MGPFLEVFMQELDYWIWLSSLSMLPRKKYLLIKEFRTPMKIYELKEHLPYLSLDDWHDMQNKKNMLNILEMRDFINKKLT